MIPSAPLPNSHFIHQWTPDFIRIVSWVQNGGLLQRMSISKTCLLTKDQGIGYAYAGELGFIDQLLDRKEIGSPMI